jgi:branched-chain amino acid transport system permease protein
MSPGNTAHLAHEATARRSRRIVGIILAVALMAVGLAVPLFVKDPYFMSVVIIFLMMGYLSTTWGIIGQTGQLSFGHSAFVGLGAYTTAILYTQLGVTPWIGLLVGGVVAVLFGVVIGLPTLRLRGTYFALATLAFASILQIVAYTTLQIGPIYIGASPGIQINLVNGGDAPRVFQFQGKAGYYYVILAMLACVLLLSFILNKRRIGYYWTAIRNDEDAAESLGINVARYRILGFLLSCFLTGAGGGFYVQYMLAIDPRRILGLGFSTEIALMGIVGGWQSLFGPVIGSAVLVPVSEFLRARLSAIPQMTTVIYGLLLVLFMIFLPQGINGLIVKAVKGVSARVSRNRQKRPMENQNG